MRSLRSLTSAGNLVGSAAPDLIGVKGNSLVVVANKGTVELGAPIDTGCRSRTPTWSSTPATGTATVPATSSPAAPTAGCCSTAATARASWPRPTAIGGGFGVVESLSAVGDVTGDGYPDLLGTPSGGSLMVYAGTGAAISNGRAVAARSRPRTGLPTDLTPFDWVIPVSDIKANGAGDYILRQPSTGYLFLYTGTKSGVAAPRFLGEGMGEYNLGG